MYKMSYMNATGFCGLEYRSPAQLESQMNSPEDFRHFYFALYRCSPDEDNEFNKRRTEVSIKYPKLVIPLGNYYVLEGHAASEILSTFYHSLTLCDDIDDEAKSYYVSRYETVIEINRKAQALPIPLNLTEGQLGTDRTIERMVHEAVLCRQLTVWNP